MSKSNENCCVFNCSSVRRTRPDLMYHAFPPEGQKIRITDEFGGSEICDRRKKWTIKLKTNKKISKHMRVCSLHFRDDDYESAGWSKRKRLLPTAVPSLNLPARSSDLTDNKKRWKSQQARARMDRRARRVVAGTTTASTSTETSDMDGGSNNHTDKNEECAVQALLLLRLSEPLSVVTKISENENSAENPNDKSVQVTMCKERSVAVQTDVSYFEGFKDSAVQVNTSDVLTISDFVKTDKQLNSLTGLHSFLLLTALVMLLGTMTRDKRVHKLTLQKRVFLVFMKLKLDLPYVVLSVLFGVTSQTCKNIFFEMVPILASIFTAAIPFPSVQEIQRNLPKCFKDFQNVRVILDCTEIPIQRHKRLCCRIKCYSHYKGTDTVKFMTGVTPAGLLSYVSLAYGGRVSDSVIFKQSQILSRMGKGEAIMVDRGFLIETLCDQHGIELIRPPFLRDKKQFSYEEAILNAKIASARVHIERSNQRIKVFKILNNRVPIPLLPLLDSIFLIICGVVNLSNPILSNDKFLDQ